MFYKAEYQVTKISSTSNSESIKDAQQISRISKAGFSLGEMSYWQILFYLCFPGALIISVNIFNFEQGYSAAWLGFLVMFICLSVIFVAIKEQRDVRNGGIITFKQGCLTGVFIALVATVIYVLVWELYLHQTDFKFAKIYSDSVIAGQVADGASAEQIYETRQKMAEFQLQYANPFIRLPMTALEIFPVGLVITLISAGLLRNHGGQRGS